jgi:hypothetical protein
VVFRTDDFPVKFGQKKPIPAEIQPIFHVFDFYEIFEQIPANDLKSFFENSEKIEKFRRRF